jgi:hypothetical protein
MAIFRDLLAFLSTEWAVIRGAPVTAIVYALLCAGAIWVVFNWTYGRRIEIKDDQISYLTSQLTDYRSKTNSSTPEQAAKQLNSLQGTLDETNRRLRPPRDQNALYQSNKIVAKVSGININEQTHTVRIQSIVEASALDMNQPVELGNLVLRYLISQDG